MYRPFPFRPSFMLIAYNFSFSHENVFNQNKPSLGTPPLSEGITCLFQDN